MLNQAMRMMMKKERKKKLKKGKEKKKQKITKINETFFHNSTSKLCKVFDLKTFILLNSVCIYPKEMSILTLTYQLQSTYVNVSKMKV